MTTCRNSNPPTRQSRFPQLGKVHLGNWRKSSWGNRESPVRQLGKAGFDIQILLQRLRQRLRQRLFQKKKAKRLRRFFMKTNRLKPSPPRPAQWSEAQPSPVRPRSPPNRPDPVLGRLRKLHRDCSRRTPSPLNRTR